MIRLGMISRCSPMLHWKMRGSLPVPCSIIMNGESIGLHGVEKVGATPQPAVEVTEGKEPPAPLSGAVSGPLPYTLPGANGFPSLRQIALGPPAHVPINTWQTT